MSGNSRTDSSPAPISAALPAASIRPRSIPIAVAATMNGSDVACISAATAVWRTPMTRRYTSAGRPRAASKAARKIGTMSRFDADEVMTHPDFRRKLEAVGFGVFIPAFFVTSGVRFDLDALVAEASNLAMVPVFLAALLLVRGLPALLYRRVLDARRTAVAGILQATSLPFIVAASAIGLELGLIDAAESAALIGAGLLSVLAFPVAGLAVLRGGRQPAVTPQPLQELPRDI